MKLKQHLQNQSLEQLEIDWRSLTYAQRVAIRLIAEADIAKQTTQTFIQKAYVFPIRFLANIQTYSFTAHWVSPSNYITTRSKIIICFLLLISTLLLNILSAQAR